MINNSASIGKQSKRAVAARIGKKIEKMVIWVVVWMMSLLFPFWICGLILAIAKVEIKPIVAMLALITISGFCGWIKIIRPLTKRFRSRNPQRGEH